MGKQYAIDSKKAKAHVYATKGEGPNPYEHGTRIHRLWEKWHCRYHDMEALADDLALAYGEYRPDKLAARNPAEPKAQGKKGSSQ